MTNNFFRQLCYTIEQEYWKRYINEYEQYGDAASTTRKRWEEWQVADDITKQMIDSLTATREDPDDELYAELEDAVSDINAENLLTKIKEERFVRWCDNWRRNTYHTIAKLQEKERKPEE